MKEYFKINVNKYAENKHFDVVRPASLTTPKSNAVMFITEKYMDKAEQLLKTNECLVFWPDNIEVPLQIAEKHAVVFDKAPRKAFAAFFIENGITNLPIPAEYDLINGAFIEKGAVIGEKCVIFPGAYIGKNVVIGENVYIASGVKIVGEVTIGKNVVIRDNTVIGADGLTTSRNADGTAMTIPQFGGVFIGDDVQIGANVVIARGAIDDTKIERGAKIDSCSFISHNVVVGEDTFVVGETIMFGSSSTGKCVLLSGNSTVRNGIHIGDNSIVGMGSVVVKSIEPKSIVKGNPAK